MKKIAKAGPAPASKSKPPVNNAPQKHTSEPQKNGPEETATKNAPSGQKTINVGTLIVQGKQNFLQSAKLFWSLFNVDQAKNLAELNMKNLPQVSDIAFYWARLAPNYFQSLETLNISFCPNVTDLGIRWIADCFPSLKQLDASGCPKVTEASLRYLAPKWQQFVTAKFDMSSVRYLPTSVPANKFSLKHCPLLLDDSTLPKGVKLPNEVPKSITMATILIIKPPEMAETFIGAEIAAPDNGDEGKIVGSPSFACCYRSDQFRIVECVEGPVVQLLVTDNSLVVFPYYLQSDAKAMEQIKSLNVRFNLVASLAKNIKAVAVPLIAKPSSSIDTTGPMDDTRISEIQAKIETQFQAFIAAHNQEAENSIQGNASGAEVTYAQNKHVTATNFLFSKDFTMIWELSQVMSWADRHKPHTDTPKSILLLFHAFEKTKQSIQMDENAFFNVDFFVQNVGKNLTGDVQASWPSLISFLAETGNCWLEVFPGTEGSLIGPKNCIASLKSFVQFLNDLTKTNSANSMTALSEEITCLAPGTPLWQIDKVKQLIMTKGSASCLTDGDCWRLMRHFECNGLAIFRQQTALILSNLRADPPIAIDHFVSGAETNSAVIDLDYPLLCNPSAIFHVLLATLSRAFHPTLLWRTGGLFTECSFVDVLITFDDERKVVNAMFLADKVASDNFDFLGGKTSSKLKSALQYSCSLAHTICCLVLGPFSDSDVLRQLGKPRNLNFLSPNTLTHLVKNIPEAGTFSRQLDATLSRCSTCYMDFCAISMLRHFHLKDSLIGEQMISPSNGGESVSKTMSIGECDITGPIGCSGFAPVSAHILNVDNIDNIVVYPGKVGNLPPDSLKLVFGSDRLVDYFVNDTAINKKKESAKPEKTGKNKSAAPTKPTPYLVSSGLRIEARLTSESETIIGVSVNGLTVSEKTFANSVVNKEISIVITPTPFNQKGAKQKAVEFPVFIHSTGTKEGGSADSGVVKPGMRLEAVDLAYPHLLCVARVTEIDKDGKWLIKFDGWGPRFDRWAEPTADNLFPCGFMEYAARAPGVIQRLSEIRKVNLTVQLQRPKNSSYSQTPFPWHKYFADLKAKAAANGERDIVAEAVPLSYFEKSHLLGFEDDPFYMQYFSEGRHVPSLTASCSEAKSKLDAPDLMNYRKVQLVPLPKIDDWSLIVWPSRGKMTDPKKTLPNFLCAWQDFTHFVNELPMPNPISINAVPALELTVILKKMLYQPRFIPDKFDQLFEAFNTECPFQYASMSVANSGTNSKATYAEYCLRLKLLPFLIDYSIMVYLANLEKTLDTNVAYELRTSANEVIDSYLVTLHAQGAQISRWSTVTVLPEKPTPQCYLINMQEAESDFFIMHEDCPKLMCGQHAYHFSTFTKATDFADVKLDWESSLSTLGNFHDGFLTLCALNTDDARSLKQPLNALHPYLTGFVGFLSDFIEKSGILTMNWLCELYLVRNELSSLPESLGNYESTLLRLDLSRNLFTEIPAVVFRLKALEYLRMDYMGLTKIGEDIRNLTNLKTLSLRYNCLTELPEGLVNLSKLETLDLSGLPSVPLSGNASSSLHIEEIAVFFENNNFPKEALDLLIKFSVEETLTALDRAAVERFNLLLFKKLARFVVTVEGDTASFPLNMPMFSSLTTLILANQSLISVPDSLESLTSLKRLDFSGCLLLSSISPKIVTCPIERLNLNDCPELKTPPAEIRKRGLADIMNYFQRLAQGSVKCKRTKLMFVGLGGAGKTTLVHALTANDDAQVARFDVTDGIDITHWKVEDIDFRMWDFAGQVVYYNTHQFFISNRAVYLLLWNIRLGHEHAGLDFWLSSIASHAPNAPILVVGTHADEVAQERSFLPEVAYRTRFESICGFHYVSSFTNLGIPELKSAIVKVALAQKHIGEAVPAAWLSLEEQLIETYVNVEEGAEDVVMLDEVKEIAHGCGIITDDETDQALTFLSDMGSIQYFRTDFLRDRVIINPQWIVDVMAKVVSVKNTKNIEDGKMKHQDIPKIWSSYEPSIHYWLLKLTEAFDLTFPLKKEPFSIVPCLLPENPPENLYFPTLEENPGHHQTKIVFLFKYLPTGLFNRVQVRLCQFSDGATIWRRGSLLRKNQHFALLSQPDSTSIQVKVQGPCPENIAFLILEVVDTLIYESFQGVQPDYLFACPACVGARYADPSMFERSRIRRAFELRIPFLQCWNYFHSVSTQELRQLFPAESSSEFETQFYRTMQEITNIRQTLKIDILIIGCSADANPDETEKSVSTPEVGRDIEKSFPNLRVVTVADPDSSTDAISYDHLAVMMRTARVVVFCLSEQFMESDRCQAAFFTGRETLRKQVLMVVIRDFDLLKYSALAFQMNDDIYVKAINRTRYKPEDVAQRLTLRLNQVNSAQEEPAKKKKPNCFISYCWQNSRDAVNRGSKADPKAIGVSDPREIKKFLADNGIDCWLDIEQIGLGGLFRDIADGIRYAQVVVVCVSDEYTQSENCLREFHFATTSCRRPIVLCPVGTGVEWQTSEVNLIICQSATTINFQVDLKENYDSLLKAVQANLKSASEGPQMLSKLGRRKTLMNMNATNTGDNTAAQKSLVLHEIIELGQRKMLRQLSGYAQSHDSRPYPRLLLLDPVTSPDPPEAKKDDGSDKASKQSETKDGATAEPDKAEAEKNDKEKGQNNGEDEEYDGDYRGEILVDEPESNDTAKNTNDPFAKLKWQVRFLCEHEGGWHPTEISIPLSGPSPSIDPGQIFRQSAGYFGPILTFLRQTSTSSLELFEPKREDLSETCHEIVSQIDQLVNPDQQTFEDNYITFRQLSISLDRQGQCGGLRRCLLALGKDLWLCEEHQSSADLRSKGANKQGVGNITAETGAANTAAESNNIVDTIGANERAKITPQNRPRIDLNTRTSRACILQ